jgi:hypothetical protein
LPTDGHEGKIRRLGHLSDGGVDLEAEELAAMRADRIDSTLVATVKQVAESRSTPLEDVA